MNIPDLRSQYRKEIELIREKVHRESIFISLSCIDEILILLEKLNLKKRSETLDEYLEKLIDYAIKNCQKVNEGLIDESHIKKAFQDIYRLELDLMRKIQSIERIGVIGIEQQPADVKVFREEIELSTSKIQPEESETIQVEDIIMSGLEEHPEEFKVTQEEEVIMESEEKLIQEEISPEEVVVTKPEEQPKEIAPSEPQIIKCPFCGLVIDEEPKFCLQCGMIFKKK